MVVKKHKSDEQALVPQPQLDSAKLQLIQGVPRFSKLLSPIMLLSGHKAEVLSMKFSPSGEHLVSGSTDKQIYLWNVYGECQNYLVLKGHNNAVLEVCWTYDEKNIVSASADKTVALWDAETGIRLHKSIHASFANACCTVRKGTQLYVSGSDDKSIRVWDPRSRLPAHSFDDKFPVTCVGFSDDGQQVYSGGIDNEIKIWDMRKGSMWIKLTGHNDTVSGLKLSPDGSYLLSNSMDQTVKIWDVRPYANAERCVKVFGGISHSFEKILLRCAWSPDGSKVSAGSADRQVTIWDTTSRKVLYKLPGHRGSVNEVDFHPKESIIGSCSSDQTIYLGEVKP